MGVEVRELRQKDGEPWSFLQKHQDPGGMLTSSRWFLGHTVYIQFPPGIAWVLKNVDIPVPFEDAMGWLLGDLWLPPSCLITYLSWKIQLQTVLGKWNLATGGFKTSGYLIVSELLEDNDIEQKRKMRFRCTETHILYQQSQACVQCDGFATVPLMCSEHHVE